MKYKEKGHRELMKLLHSRFNEADEDSRGWDEDMDDTDEEMEGLYQDNGFGDPMDTFVEDHPKRKSRYDDYSEDDDFDEDESLDDEEAEEDMDDEDMRPSKDHRKNLAVIMLGKKIGKGKAKKM